MEEEEDGELAGEGQSGGRSRDLRRRWWLVICCFLRLNLGASQQSINTD